MTRPSKEYLEEKSWEEKAKENPLYGVMSLDEFSGSGPEPSPEELELFYSRGREMVDQWIKPWLLETRTTEQMKILEFGCGMGRLVKSVADDHTADNVYGIDISKTIVEHANKNVTNGAHFSVLNDEGGFSFEDNHFDRIYSYAVFQHIKEKSVVEKSIREIARTLKPGGKVRLNFEMVFMPPFENTYLQDTYAFERQFLIYGWSKKFGVPVCGAKLKRSTNWSGIRFGYKQLLREFARNGIKMYGIAREPTNQGQGFIWFFGEKVK